MPRSLLLSASSPDLQQGFRGSHMCCTGAGGGSFKPNQAAAEGPDHAVLEETLSALLFRPLGGSVAAKMLEEARVSA
ncbi:hypothetical protein GN956_G577 [Arapaima gigas]